MNIGEPPHVKARQLVRPLAYAMAIGFALSLFSENDSELEFIERVLADCAALRAWPLLEPLADLYADLCDWLLEDTAHLKPCGGGPLWEPGCTALVLSVLLRCGLLYAVVHTVVSLARRLFAHLLTLTRPSSSSTPGSTAPAGAIFACRQGAALLVAVIPAFVSLLFGAGRVVILLFLLACHKTLLALQRSADAARAGIDKCRSRKTHSKITTTIKNTTNIASSATETPPFWNGLCHGLARHCRHIRDELDQVQERHELEIAGIRAGHAQDRAGLQARIDSANAELQRLDMGLDAGQTIATLRAELASANRAVEGLGDQVRRLKDRNDGTLRQMERDRKGFDETLCNLGKDPFRAHEMVVPKYRCDSLQKSLDYVSTRYEKQFKQSEIHKKEVERLSKENSAMKTELDWIRFHVPSPPTRRATRAV